MGFNVTPPNLRRTRGQLGRRVDEPHREWVTSSAKPNGGVADPVAKRCRRGDAHAVQIVDLDPLTFELGGVAQYRARQRRRGPQPVQVPGSEQTERNRVAAAPRPLVFAMIMVGERVAAEAFDLVGP